MALIKKTIVLAEKKNLGYASVIQVGSETGAKIVGDTFEKDMQAALRIGRQKFFFPLTGAVTEIPLSAKISPEDDVGCLIAKNGTLIAKGGAAPALQELPTDFTVTPEPPRPEPGTVAPTSDPHPLSNDKPEDKEILDRLSKERDNYYATVREKVDELFIVNPAFPALSTLIPDSEWVKVRYEGDDYYVVGRLYGEDRRVSFLGYGVPGIKSVRPPKVADGIASFLPEQEKSEKGYWLFFQNAENGKIE